jgi:hypothetical protein
MMNYEKEWGIRTHLKEEENRFSAGEGDKGARTQPTSPLL